MAPIWTKNGPFWTNMAQGIPGNSHEVKIGLMPMKYIQTDHLDPVLSLSGPYSGSLRSFYGPIGTQYGPC